LEQRPLSPIRNRSGYDLFAFIELQSVHLIEDVVKRVLPEIESLEAAAERDRYLDLFDGDRDAVGEAKALDSKNVALTQELARRIGGSGLLEGEHLGGGLLPPGQHFFREP